MGQPLAHVEVFRVRPFIAEITISIDRRDRIEYRDVRNMAATLQDELAAGGPRVVCWKAGCDNRISPGDFRRRWHIGMGIPYAVRDNQVDTAGIEFHGRPIEQVRREICLLPALECTVGLALQNRLVINKCRRARQLVAVALIAVGPDHVEQRSLRMLIEFERVAGKSHRRHLVVAGRMTGGVDLVRRTPVGDAFDKTHGEQFRAKTEEHAAGRRRRWTDVIPHRRIELDGTHGEFLLKLGIVSIRPAAAVVSVPNVRAGLIERDIIVKGTLDRRAEMLGELVEN